MEIRKGIRAIEHERKKLDVNIIQTKANAGSIDEIMDALVELGELFAEQDDAIVELAEMIGG